MKPGLLAAWLPLELVRLQSCQGWPNNLVVDKIVLVTPEGIPYLVMCPDTKRAVEEILADGVTTNPEGS